MSLSLAADKLHRDIIEGVSEGICVFLYNADYVDVEFILWNRQMVEITGYEINEVNDLHCFLKLFRELKDFDRVWEYLNRVKCGEALDNQEVCITTKNGEIKDVLLCAKILERQGENIPLMVLVNDITKHVEKERQLSEIMYYDKLRTEFFANISHEFRTPLNVILSAMQLMNAKLRGMLGDNQFKSTEKYTSMMKQNCFRLLRLVNNLIDVTKIDSGYLELELCNLDMVSLVENITMSVKPYIENKGIELNFHTDIRQRILACDPDKIERILLNLISNAVKFTKPGGRIEVVLKDLNNAIQLTVKDTGIGIPKEKQKLIFERFVRIEETMARECEGSGIGLSLVKSLVEMHGGTIYLLSEYGKGTVFTIKLPVKTLKNESRPREFILNSNNRIERAAVEFSDIYI